MGTSSRFRPGEVEGLIFDAVGTLIEPNPSVALAYAAAARRQGVEIDTKLVKARFHQYFRDDEVDDQLGPMRTSESIEHQRWRRIVTKVLPELPDPDRAFEELWDHFGRPDAWRTFEDVSPALEALERAGVPYLIGSNFDGRLRGVILGLTDLRPQADSLVISSQVGYRKPHPDFYRAACRSLGLPPERVLCVGDDPENDVRGPKRAGLQGLLLDRDGRRPDDLPFSPDLNVLVDSLLACTP